jgi:hypothetical protein
MPLSPKAIEATRREWRELGFFCHYRSEQAEWQITGDKQGLLKFVELLKKAVSIRLG